MEFKELASTDNAILVAVGIYVAKSIFETVKSFVVKKVEDSSKALTANTLAIKDLTMSVKSLEKDVQDITKLRLDLRRYYGALKMLAGDKWPSIRKELEEEFKHGE